MVYPKRRIHLPPEAPLTRLRRFVWRSLIKGTLQREQRRAALSIQQETADDESETRPSDYYRAGRAQDTSGTGPRPFLPDVRVAAQQAGAVWSSPEHLGAPQSNPEHHGAPWSTPEHDGAPRSTTEHPGARESTLSCTPPGYIECY
eukprot:gene25191-biopygen7466